MEIDIEELMARPYGLDDLIASYEGEGDDAYETDSALDDAKAAIQTATDGIIDEIAAELGADKSSAASAINTLIDNLKASLETMEGLEGVDTTELETALDQLKAAQAAAIDDSITIDAAARKASITAAVDTNLPDNVTVSKIAVLTAVKADLKAAIEAEGYTYACGRCAEGGDPQGRYPLSNDTKDDTDTKKIHCVTCNGYGAQPEPIVPEQVWQNNMP